MKKNTYQTFHIGALGNQTSPARFDEVPPMPRFVEYPMVLPLLRIENLNGVSTEMAQSLDRAGFLYLHELLPLALTPRAAQTLAAASGLAAADVEMLLKLATSAQDKLVDTTSCLQGVRMVLLHDFDKSALPGIKEDDLPPLLDAAESLLMALLATFEDDEDAEGDEEQPEPFEGVMPIFPLHVAEEEMRMPDAMPFNPSKQPFFVMRTG